MGTTITTTLHAMGTNTSTRSVGIMPTITQKVTWASIIISTISSQWSEKGNSVHLSGVSDLDEHHKTQNDFDYQHYSYLVTDIYYLSKNLFAKYHYVLILPDVSYEYFYLTEIYFQSAHLLVCMICPIDYRSRESYYWCYLNISSSITHPRFLFWMVDSSMTAIISFSVLASFSIGQMYFKLLFLVLLVGHTSACGQVLDQWPALPQYWQGTCDLLTLII